MVRFEKQSLMLKGFYCTLPAGQNAQGFYCTLLAGQNAHGSAGDPSGNMVVERIEIPTIL